jgi:putative ABC transport system ATP-binding protein
MSARFARPVLARQPGPGGNQTSMRSPPAAWVAARSSAPCAAAIALTMASPSPRLGGLDRPTQGQLRFGGQDLATATEAQVRKVRASSFGFIFQTFNLIPTLSAQENVEAALVPLGIHLAERRARVRTALDSVGLADRAQHLPGELSGGQQQRVAIARGLVKEPRVLLADEPTGNLDEDTRDEIIGLLDTLWRERRLTLTIVLVSHDSSVEGAPSGSG